MNEALNLVLNMVVFIFGSDVQIINTNELMVDEPTASYECFDE
jgi:hypothetical protein